MAIFAYKALDKTGKEIKAQVNSDSVQTAKSKIRAQGLMLLEIKEQKTDKAKQKATITFGSGVSTPTSP